MSAVGSAAIPQVHLAAGQLLVSREPQIIVTVLGSCVTVTMMDLPTGIAAICHAMLPHPRPKELLAPGDPTRFRFVSHAVPAMLAVYRRAGVDPRRITIKLFGGGNVIGPRTEPVPGQSVGASNVAAARELLAAAGLQISAENTGGCHGRKILFNTATGEVLHKRLRHISP